MRAGTLELQAAAGRVAAANPEAPRRALVRDIVTASFSADALAPALLKLPSAATPAAARAAQATENVWRAIDEEFGLLSSSEVAAVLGSRGSNRSFASEQRSAGRLLGVRRLNSYVYPGFQFDRDLGRVREVVAPLLALAERLDRSPEGVALWLVAPTTYFDGARPVDHITDPEHLLGVASEAWRVDW